MSAPSFHFIPARSLDKKIVESAEQSSDTAIQVLMLKEDVAKRQLIRGTTKTAYRRIHEIVSSALEEVERGVELSQAVLALTKALILVRYQLARELISRELTNQIEPIVEAVLDCVKKQRDTSKCREHARNGRVILDALAVLVYEYGKE
jgi:hypothetical protein